jgi:hypothetical protein
VTVTAGPNSISNSGSSYVFFGSTVGFEDKISLSLLNGENGFSIIGIATNCHSGWWVREVGDVNDAAIDDVLIGIYNFNSYIAYESSGMSAISNHSISA